jgi:hypothetical protein
MFASLAISGRCREAQISDVARAVGSDQNVVAAVRQWIQVQQLCDQQQELLMLWRDGPAVRAPIAGDVSSDPE